MALISSDKRSRPRQRAAWLIVALLVVLTSGAMFFARPLWSALPLAWRMQLMALGYRIKVDHSVRIKTADDVQLASSLYLPRKKIGEGRLATVLIRLPYDRRTYDEALGAAMFFARHGYAVLVQDIRGKFESGGRFIPWQHSTADGAATLDWIARQPWSNGRVGTFGCSALGELQYTLARAQHPAHAAMISSGAGGALASATASNEVVGFFEGGVFQLASGLGWFIKHGMQDPQAAPAAPFDLAALRQQLPISGLVARVRPGANAYADYLSAPLMTPRWHRFDFVDERVQLMVPTLDINTWGDQTVGATLTLAGLARSAGNKQHHVVIGPGQHCQHQEVGALSRFGELAVTNADRPYQEWYLRWFNHHLRAQPQQLNDLPAYQVYVLGEDRWLSSDSWPPAAAIKQRLYLNSDGQANSARGNGRLTAAPSDKNLFDRFDYDPMQPVPSRGGPMCCTGVASDLSGPQDQRDVEARSDVLVYTSPPLSASLRLAGPLQATLYLSTNVLDTDLIARLTDVSPDGKSINIQEGALRARYREGLQSPLLLTPGAVTKLVVDMRSIAWRLPAGHRLRLQVTSSSFPRLERNLNSGGNNADESQATIAHQQIHHGADSASFVEFSALVLKDDE